MDDLPPRSKGMRFFVLDCHSSATNDIKSILEILGHEVVYWPISVYFQKIFGHDKRQPEIINASTWLDLNKEMCDQFSEKYESYLSQFDGFIVSAFSSFALLFERFDKPIIVVNAVRYEIPFTDKPASWDLLNQFLVDGVKRHKIFLVSNNKGDAIYLKKATGLDSELIPSLGLYTNAKYSGKNNAYVFHNPKKNPFIETFKSYLRLDSLIHSPPENYLWQTLYDYKGIIHIPYQVSIMSLFEQYSANVPLFFPSKECLIALQSLAPANVLNEISFFWLLKKIPPSQTPGDLNNLSDPNVVKFWIDSADYYDKENMPYIQYFDSPQHLKFLLLNTDTQEISRKMQADNLKKKEWVLKKWEEVLDRVSQT